MSDGRYLLDASALLAFLFQERGGSEVAQILDHAAISAVNLAEVVAKQLDCAVTPEAIRHNLGDINLPVVPFDETIALETGHLRRATRALGLSLADRACLATARATGMTVVTADRAWGGLDLGVAIEVIR
ncbi:MAG: type II toxin-antitoxin system VapC family toxin [Qipengyuania sp.]|jgi:ribonuclease VapC|nr:type II toxin-antitoxin system VapC family toxin [Qipengyuania sp.]